MKVYGPQPGQFGLVRTTGILGALIRIGTRSPVNHAFIVLEGGSAVVEARMGGATVRPLAEYDPATITYSHWDLAPNEANEVVMQALILTGTPYNFLDILVLALASFGIRWGWVRARAQRTDRLICSQLVDRVYTNAGLNLFTDGRLDGDVTPGDLLLAIAQRDPVEGISRKVIR